MTVFQELVKGMRLMEPSTDIKNNMIRVLSREFNCPPWNDRYDDGCRCNQNCELCWLSYLNSDVTGK